MLGLRADVDHHPLHPLSATVNGGGHDQRIAASRNSKFADALVGRFFVTGVSGSFQKHQKELETLANLQNALKNRSSTTFPSSSHIQTTLPTTTRERWQVVGQPVLERNKQTQLAMEASILREMEEKLSELERVKVAKRQRDRQRRYRRLQHFSAIIIQNAYHHYIEKKKQVATKIILHYLKKNSNWNSICRMATSIRILRWFINSIVIPKWKKWKQKQMIQMIAEENWNLIVDVASVWTSARRIVADGFVFDVIQNACQSVTEQILAKLPKRRQKLVQKRRQVLVKRLRQRQMDDETGSLFFVTGVDGGGFGEEDEEYDEELVWEEFDAWTDCDSEEEAALIAQEEAAAMAAANLIARTSGSTKRSIGGRSSRGPSRRGSMEETSKGRTPRPLSGISRISKSATGSGQTSSRSARLNTERMSNSSRVDAIGSAPPPLLRQNSRHLEELNRLSSTTPRKKVYDENDERVLELKRKHQQRMKMDAVANAARIAAREKRKKLEEEEAAARAAEKEAEALRKAAAAQEYRRAMEAEQLAKARLAANIREQREAAKKRKEAIAEMEANESRLMKAEDSWRPPRKRLSTKPPITPIPHELKRAPLSSRVDGALSTRGDTSVGFSNKPTVDPEEAARLAAATATAAAEAEKYREMLRQRVRDRKIAAAAAAAAKLDEEKRKKEQLTKLLTDYQDQLKERQAILVAKRRREKRRLREERRAKKRQEKELSESISAGIGKASNAESNSDLDKKTFLEKADSLSDSFELTDDEDENTGQPHIDGNVTLNGKPEIDDCSDDEAEGYVYISSATEELGEPLTDFAFDDFMEASMVLLVEDSPNAPLRLPTLAEDSQEDIQSVAVSTTTELLPPPISTPLAAPSPGTNQLSTSDCISARRPGRSSNIPKARKEKRVVIPSFLRETPYFKHLRSVADRTGERVIVQPTSNPATRTSSAARVQDSTKSNISGPHSREATIAVAGERSSRRAEALSAQEDRVASLLEMVAAAREKLTADIAAASPAPTGRLSRPSIPTSARSSVGSASTRQESFPIGLSSARSNNSVAPSIASSLGSGKISVPKAAKRGKLSDNLYNSVSNDTASIPSHSKTHEHVNNEAFPTSGVTSLSSGIASETSEFSHLKSSVSVPQLPFNTKPQDIGLMSSNSSTVLPFPPTTFSAMKSIAPPSIEAFSDMGTNSTIGSKSPAVGLRGIGSLRKGKGLRRLKPLRNSQPVAANSSVKLQSFVSDSDTASANRINTVRQEKISGVSSSKATSSIRSAANRYDNIVSPNLESTGAEYYPLSSSTNKTFHTTANEMEDGGDSAPSTARSGGSNRVRSRLTEYADYETRLLADYEEMRQRFTQHIAEAAVDALSASFADPTHESTPSGDLSSEKDTGAVVHQLPMPTVSNYPNTSFSVQDPDSELRRSLVAQYVASLGDLTTSDLLIDLLLEDSKNTTFNTQQAPEKSPNGDNNSTPMYGAVGSGLSAATQRRRRSESSIDTATVPVLENEQKYPIESEFEEEEERESVHAIKSRAIDWSSVLNSNGDSNAALDGICSSFLRNMVQHDLP